MCHAFLNEGFLAVHSHIFNHVNYLNNFSHASWYCRALSIILVALEYNLTGTKPLYIVMTLCTRASVNTVAIFI